jgi:hypothetical protein
MMRRYEVTLTDGTVEVLETACDWQRDETSIWFPRTPSDRSPARCWSGRPASFESASIVIIKRTDPLARSA